MKLKSLNDLHVTVCLKTYIQPKTIKIIYKIFTKFKDLSTLKIFTRLSLPRFDEESGGFHLDSEPLYIYSRNGRCERVLTSVV